MSATLSRLNDRGRTFVNKHVLKKSAAPARPASPLPSAPVLQQVTPPARPAVPPVRPAVPATPLPQRATATRRGQRENDRFGNDSPEGGLPVQAPEQDRYGNDSREMSDAASANGGGSAGPNRPAAPTPPSSARRAADATTTASSSSSSSDSSLSDTPLQTPIAPPGPNYLAALAQAPGGPDYAANAGDFFDSASSSSEETSSSDESSSEEEPPPALPPKHAAVQIDDSARDIMKTKLPPQKYDGEFNKAAFRGSTPQASERTDNVTRFYTEEEQTQNELAMQADGTFNKAGATVRGGQVGYAMDADGRMVAFKEYERTVVTRAADGSETREDGYDGVPIGTGQRLESTHHSSALGADTVTDAAGKAVLDATGRPMMRARPAAAAGTVDFGYDGKIKNISNNSGHYMPTVEYLGQAIEHLLIKGAFFKNELTDASGKTLHPDSKEGVLYDKVQKKLAEVATIQQQVGATEYALKSVEAKGRTDKVGELTGKLANLGKQLEDVTAMVDQATAVLRKLGIGPSQRVREDVTAEFLDIKPGMTGPEIKVAAFKKMPAQDFLKSGGGNVDQEQRKGKVGEEASRPFREQSKARMDELDAKLKSALNEQDSAELSGLMKQSRAARVAASMKQFDERRPNLAADKPADGEDPAETKQSDPPALTEDQEKRMNALRDKLKGALTKEEAMQLVALKKRSRVAPGIATANAEAEERAERIGGSEPPDIDEALRGVGIHDAESLYANEFLANDSESESDEDSYEESGEDSAAASEDGARSAS